MRKYLVPMNLWRWFYDLPKTETLDKTDTKTETETKTKAESSDKIMERVHDPDKDDYILKPKDNTTPQSRPKAVVPCWACDETFKNDTALSSKNTFEKTLERENSHN